MCKKELPLTEFYNRSDDHGDGLQGTCKSCMKLSKKRMRSDPVKWEHELELRRLARLEDPVTAHRNDRSRNLKRFFNITIEEYEQIYTFQGGKCAICGKPETAVLSGKVKRLAVDHCHDTGVVRGLLCGRCNTAIGLLNHDIDLLALATDYLLSPIMPWATDEGSSTSSKA